MSDAAIKAALEAAARKLCFSSTRICGCVERCKADAHAVVRAWGDLAAAVEAAAREGE